MEYSIKPKRLGERRIIHYPQKRIIGLYVNKVYEAVRYSDPMSNEALAGVEAQITLKVSELVDAIEKSDIELVKKTVREIVILLNDRNKKCKLLK